jgi:hypothetical protein
MTPDELYEKQLREELKLNETWASKSYHPSTIAYLLRLLDEARKVKPSSSNNQGTPISFKEFIRRMFPCLSG